MTIIQLPDDPRESHEVIQGLSEILKKGGLVAFPTETVYGLGANGLDTTAVRKLFAYKKRPFSDPVILHVDNPVAAEKLWKLSECEKLVFRRLAEMFWPGPLTIVSHGNENVPPVVSADTQFVAVRCPRNIVCRQLISECGFPLAGPSANPFGRITPTTASHVENYFPDLPILDGGNCCDVGVESTVAKLYLSNDTDRVCVRILRKGAVGEEEIKEVLNGYSVTVETHSNVNEKSESPGMCLQHYSPSVPTYYSSSDMSIDPQSSKLVDSKTLVLVDIYGKIKQGQQEFGLLIKSTNNNITHHEVAAHLFALLHEAERGALDNGFQMIVIHWGNSEDQVANCTTLAGAIFDRVFRASAGRRLAFEQSDDKLQLYSSS